MNYYETQPATYSARLPASLRNFRYLQEKLAGPPRARDIVFSSCHFHDDRTCDLLAAVVMPDHVHLILVPMIDEVKRCVVPLEWITRSIKGYSARQINAQAGKRGQVWQDESFDHVIRKGDFGNKLEYLLQNPVRKGVVTEWQMYRWCYWKGSA